MIFVKTADCRTDYALKPSRRKRRHRQKSPYPLDGSEGRSDAVSDGELRGEVAHLEFSTEGAVLEGGKLLIRDHVLD